MTVKEILKSAILFAGKPELLALDTFLEASQNSPTVIQQAEIDLFVQCFNYVYKEISGIHCPLLQQEEIVFCNNEFPINNLSKNIISIKKLNKNRKKLKFNLISQKIYCETDKAIITYSVLPNDFALNDEVDLFGGRVMPQVMAYGVAREYCLIGGNFGDAELWETRFRHGLRGVFSTKQINLLPKRSFFSCC